MGRGTGEAAGKGEQCLPRLLTSGLLQRQRHAAEQHRSHVKKKPARLERAGSPTSYELEAGGPEPVHRRLAEKSKPACRRHAR